MNSLKTSHLRPARGAQAILVVVHPYATATGPGDCLESISDLVANWDGNVYVLTDRGGNPNASLQGSHFLDVLFDRTAAAEDRGETRRIPADEDFGELHTAVDILVEETAPNAEYTVTGASMEGACTTVARALGELGRSAVIDSSAITADDRASAILQPADEDVTMQEFLHDMEEA